MSRFNLILEKANSGLIRDVFGPFVIKVLSASITFLLNIVVARLLGIEQAGYFLLAQTLLVVMAFIVRQGFDNAVVRLVSHYNISNSSSNTFKLYLYSIIRILPLSLALSVLVVFFSSNVASFFFDTSEFSDVVLLAVIALTPIAFTQLNSFFLQGNKNVKSAMFFRTTAVSLLSVISMLIFIPDNAVGAMKIYVLCSFVSLLLSSIIWLRKIDNWCFSFEGFDFHYVNRVVKPLFWVVVLTQVVQWSSQLILGILADPHDVALFSAAQRTAMLTSFILVAVNSISAPRFSEAYSNNDIQKLKVTSDSVSKLLISISLPMLIVLILLSSQIMSVFGNEYKNGQLLLIVLSIGQVFNVATGSVGYLLQMTDNSNFFKKSVVISSAILVIGNCLFIPIFGVISAAVFTSIAVIVQNALCVYYVKKCLGFNTLSYLKFW